MSECTSANVRSSIADWASVPVSSITSQTQLDGLGGKSWPDDAPSLVTVLESLCDTTIPQEDYELFEDVEDIENYLGIEGPSNE
ncbi:hypothetical protein GF359_04565 [candidate division WOR-3 bacterium]|uniref:Uncharacterized protein n=1 Tax=candidate division WOR-3 bacterium TaxID=2052148 RepID=A0A9D5QCA6_UNCW3|nr:hypothetical protein [candidate division WOR-3 bacterium]MBD3364468.1 hypothetical protein [candidate division WOR-3 bacterium]